jgi:2-amino-4-hydroxy-6-hydroxymethyldihydropteridine diphosphokinase
MGDRENNLAQALQEIEGSCGHIVQVSSLYQTAAWGKTNQPPFLNQALLIQTSFTAERLMQELLHIEQKLGRLRQEKFGPRIIDIDILLFDDMIINSVHLKIPHPEMQNRRFVLIPLAEIAATVIHPVLHKSIKELLKECPDTLPVNKYP